MRSGGLIDLALSGAPAEDLPSLSEWREISSEESDHKIVHRGDVWLLPATCGGNHRLICGDSTNPKDVARVLDGTKPHLMVTDPPYGVAYSANWREKRLGGERASGTVRNDSRADWTKAWMLFPGDVAYVWHAASHVVKVYNSLENSGFVIRNQIIWVKNRIALSQGHYHWQHEPCAYAVRKGATAHWCIDRFKTKEEGHGWQSTVWEVAHRRSETGHSTQKPLECMARPIRNNSQEGDSVYEPFCGSGTTIVAAESLRRRCYAIEIDSRYVYITLLRYQQETGKTVFLEETGESFSEVIGRRGKEDAQQSLLKEDFVEPVLTCDPVLVELCLQGLPENATIVDFFYNATRAGVAQALGFRYNAACSSPPTSKGGSADFLLWFAEPPSFSPREYADWLGSNAEKLKQINLPRAALVIEDVRIGSVLANAPHHVAAAFQEANYNLTKSLVVSINNSHKHIMFFEKG